MQLCAELENGQNSDIQDEILDTDMTNTSSGSIDSSTHGRIMDSTAHSRVADSSVRGGMQNVPAPDGKPRVLKFEMQLYKMRDGEYTVDVQVGLKKAIQHTTQASMSKDSVRRP